MASALASSRMLLGRRSFQAAFRSVQTAAEPFATLTESEMFSSIKSRAEKGVVEKILVKVNLKDGNIKQLLMNKNISTPHSCALHINSGMADASVLCVVKDEKSGDEQISSMRLPLAGPCTLEFLSFQNEEHAETVNQAYWRSCSLMMGALLTRSFNDPVEPHGVVSTKYQDGFFSYDIHSKNLADWEPNHTDFASLVLSLYSEYIAKGLPFEALRVSAEVAAQFRQPQSSSSSSSPLLVRVGEHVEVMDGPVISSTSQIGRFSILNASKKTGNIWRFNGVSLPSCQSTSSYNWKVIADHAATASSK